MKTRATIMGLALLSAMSFGSAAEANTVNIFTCPGSSPSTGNCTDNGELVTSGGSIAGFLLNGQLDTTSPFRADAIDLKDVFGPGGNNETNTQKVFEQRTGIDVTFTPIRDDTPDNPFTVSNLYFAVKFDQYTAFFQNLTGGPISVTFQPLDRLSNFTILGGTVAVPGPIAGAGLPALMALGGFVWARRRKAAAATA